MIRTYETKDAAALLTLWNSAGVQAGYAPLTAAEFHRLLLGHRDFSPAFTFVLEEAGAVSGFVSGCTGDHIPKGDVRGYVSCLLLAEQANTAANAAALLGALEQAFRAAGRSQSAVTFFNPIRLPWILPGTPGHQHNNVPGVAQDLPLHGWMLDMGYREGAVECAMHLDLADFALPDWVEKKAGEMEKRGYYTARFDPARHTGLREMLDALGNAMWSSEIPEAARQGLPLLVGLKGDTCVGFTGPIYPEATGRGYFAGIGVAPRYQRNGLGTVLFYRLLQWEKEAGAKYMSLFTGEENPAKQIYLGAGFRVARKFGVMLKEL